jgi:predicted nuclease of predicted toxin-antitoxin system
MKLLFDQNLSPSLVVSLNDVFPQSEHVFNIGLDRAGDSVVWEYARNNAFVLVTKDADFADLSVLRGFPPKVIWIRRGNCATRAIEFLLRSNVAVIQQLESDDTLGFVPIF